jgi:hypothetical protein
MTQQTCQLRLQWLTPFFFPDTLDLSQVAPAFSSGSYAFPEDSDHIAEQQQHAVVHVHFVNGCRRSATWSADLRPAVFQGPALLICTRSKS